MVCELDASTSDPSAEGVSQRKQARQITSNSTQRGNRDDNFGALLTSDWQPKVAASVLAR